MNDEHTVTVIETVSTTGGHYVAFSDASMATIVAEFSGQQDVDFWPFQSEIEEEDPRYLEWMLIMNPPPDLLGINSTKLQTLTQLATAQKAALTNRISTINDAIELEMASPEEEIELPKRVLQLKAWKTYAVLLGRVTSQVGWPPEVTWPVQPAEGMDLTVSAVAP